MSVCFCWQRCAFFNVKALVLSTTFLHCMCPLMGFHVPFVTGGHLTYCVIALMHSHISWRLSTCVGNLKFLIRVHDRVSLPPLSGRGALPIENGAARLLRTFLHRIHSLMSLYFVRNGALLPACVDVGMTSVCGGVLFFSLRAEAFICVLQSKTKKVKLHSLVTVCMSSSNALLIFKIFHSRFSLTVQPSSSSLMIT